MGKKARAAVPMSSPAPAQQPEGRCPPRRKEEKSSHASLLRRGISQSLSARVGRLGRRRARGNHPRPVSGIASGHGHGKGICSVCRWVMCHISSRSSHGHQAIQRSRIFFLVAFSYVSRMSMDVTYHVTSRGDLELGGFAGLDSGHDS